MSTTPRFIPNVSAAIMDTRQVHGITSPPLETGLNAARRDGRQETCQQELFMKRHL